MTVMNKNTRNFINALIVASGKVLELSQEEWRPETVEWTLLSPDGSQRLFYRLKGPDDRRILVILPPDGEENGFKEAESSWMIGRHLYEHGVPVPKLYDFDHNSGRLFVEDLGDQRLYDLLQNAEEELLPWYQQVTSELVRMQVNAVQGFSSSWCWDTPCYDQQLMRERESGYFLQALCKDYLDVSFDQQKVEAECLLLARRAGYAPADFFLHRDFQSRNIMVKDGKIRIIDYQGGRRGPLAYDLASLLIDPYMGLTSSVQHKIKEFYLTRLQEHLSYDRQQFEQEYFLLALQRNLQILGAFAFLSQQRKKPFFSQFIEPALCSLNSLLAKPEADDYGALRAVTSQCLFLMHSIHC
jgi:aminoglycoside/choline kinase family phosphotransferase